MGIVGRKEKDKKVPFCTNPTDSGAIRVPAGSPRTERRHPRAGPNRTLPKHLRHLGNPLKTEVDFFLLDFP